MRTMIVAALVCAFFAMSSASAGVPRSDQGLQDECQQNNAKQPGSCLKLPGQAASGSPVVVYVDTGRADGYTGVWMEDNGWTGLQKGEFYDEFGAEVLGDTELL